MSAIIFDFDGTIANSFDFAVKFMADEAKMSPLSAEQIQELRDLSMIAMARKLGYAWWRLPRLFYKGRKVMQKNIKNIKPFEGMSDVIRKLHAEGHELFILSSNTVANIHAFLHQHQLHTYFLEVYGGIGLFGKAPYLRKLVKTHKLELKNCIYIGDELRDVEAAQSIKLNVIAVTWGFAKPQDLKTLKPTSVVNQPAELLRYLENI